MASRLRRSKRRASSRGASAAGSRITSPCSSRPFWRLSARGRPRRRSCHACTEPYPATQKRISNDHFRAGLRVFIGSSLCAMGLTFVVRLVAINNPRAGLGRRGRNALSLSQLLAGLHARSLPCQCRRVHVVGFCDPVTVLPRRQRSAGWSAPPAGATLASELWLRGSARARACSTSSMAPYRAGATVHRPNPPEDMRVQTPRWFSWPAMQCPLSTRTGSVR